MKKEKKIEFSKKLLIQESILIWIITLGFITLAYLAMKMGYSGSLPWLAALPSVAWAAYGTSQGFYYNKSKKENSVGGIVYDTAMIAAAAEAIDLSGEDKEMPEYPILPEEKEIDPFGPM